MFANTPVMKVFVLLFCIAAATASPIFFHPKQTRYFITSRKDTVSATVNQIPKTVVKARPVANLNVPVPVPAVIQVQNQVPVQHVHPVQAVQAVQAVQPIQPVQPVQSIQSIQPIQPIQTVQPVQMSVAKPHTPQELNKLFTDMKNSKKPFMTISMKTPAKSTSIFPDPFSLFDDNNEHIVVHVPYNVHTIHHHHVQHVPVYKPVPIVKHVPVHVVKEVAIPVHLPDYKDWQPAAQWW